MEAKQWQAFPATVLLERSKFGLNELLGRTRLVEAASQQTSQEPCCDLSATPHLPPSVVVAECKEHAYQAGSDTDNPEHAEPAADDWLKRRIEGRGSLIGGQAIKPAREKPVKDREQDGAEHQAALPAHAIGCMRCVPNDLASRRSATLVVALSAHCRNALCAP